MEQVKKLQGIEREMETQHKAFNDLTALAQEVVSNMDAESKSIETIQVRDMTCNCIAFGEVLKMLSLFGCQIFTLFFFL